MTEVNKEKVVTLEKLRKDEVEKFKKDMQEAFAVAVIEEFGSISDGPIPSDEDIEKTIGDPCASAYHIILDGEKVGGVVLNIDEVNLHNSLDFLFIAVGKHGGGIGEKAWKAIEAKYPNTKIWETHTPYFEKRNIHFYVNKCGFKIVEYFNKYHSDPHMADNEELPGGEDFFRFEKVMKS